jgi:hypothetical protein
MKVVYHGVPKDMVGHTVYPLNQLSEIAPQAYEFQKAKYAGREAVLDFHIPRLGVLFNDTVHCAALDPRQLCGARQRLGLPIPGTGMSSRMTGLFFAIPLERILQHRVVWYSGRTLWINGAPDEDVPLTPPDDEFEPFNPRLYRELSEPTSAHLAYLARMKSAGKPPLMFVHIPHILVAGPIDVSGLEPVKWESNPTVSEGTAPPLASDQNAATRRRPGGAPPRR